MHAVRGAGVQELGRRIAQAVGERRRFARRIIGQAEDDEVHLRHHVAPRGGIAAAIGGQALQLDVGQRAQAIADAQASGSRLHRR